MTATEELRRMLDERGVDYRVSATGYSIDIGPYTTAYANRSDTTLDVSLRQVTPEQAIAATLGSCNRSDSCTNGERTDVSRLPYWWTNDGTLHIELPKLPESISVLLPDQRDREVGSARVWQYMRDSGTCHDVWDTELTGRLRFQCSECKAVSLEITPNFCPVCGRRVEVDE